MTNEYITLNNGMLMPRVGLGTLNCHGEDLRKALRSSLECGYRSIDAAFVCNNEKAIGEELQDWFAKGKLKREEVFVTSKLPPIANRAEDVSRFLNMSLDNLKLNYLDLYLIHHPFGLQCLGDNNIYARDSNGISAIDYDTDHVSLWKELEKQVDAGKIKAIGVSNFNSEQVKRIMKIARIAPVVNQVEIHVSLQQRSLVQTCQEIGVAVVSYSPLGAPYLEEGRLVSVLDHPKILEIGNRYGKSGAQVILKFLLQRGLVVIPKSKNPERIKSNADISDFKLSNEEMETLYELDQGEKARVYRFTGVCKGIENHKEYPFQLQE